MSDRAAPLVDDRPKTAAPPWQPPADASAPGPPPRRRWRPGSAARLATLHAIVLAAILGASVIALVRNYRTGNQEIVARELAAELRSFREAAVGRSPRTDLQAFAEAYLRTHAVAAGEAMIIAVPGRGTVGSPDAGVALADPHVREALEHPPGTTHIGPATVAGRHVELLVAPLVEGRQVVGTLVGTADLSIFASEQTRITVVSLIEAAIALIAGVTSAFLLLRRLLRTVGRITTTADNIGQGRLEERLGDQGTDDEVGQLASSFDAMLDRVEGAVGAQRRLLSDVSHQLRTPLTVARGHLEVLVRTDLGDAAATQETVELVLDELDHMRGLVDRLSQLGQAMEPDSLTVDAVDLRGFLSDVHDACRVLAPRDWRFGPVPDLVVDLDVAKFRGALLNLVQNAVNATTDTDTIELSAGVDPHRRLRVAVDDSGPGIPPEQRVAALDRFARPGAREAGGSGLGLAIARAVAGAHDGFVDIGTSRLGGARVSLIVPLGVAPS